MLPGGIGAWSIDLGCDEPGAGDSETVSSASGMTIGNSLPIGPCTGSPSLHFFA